MRICTHLSFNGQCEEAFHEYCRILDGAIGTMMKYGESPCLKQRTLSGTIALSMHRFSLGNLS